MRFFLNTLFPARCIICGEIFYYSDQNVVCEYCINSMNQEDLDYCHSCGKKNKNCQECLKQRVFKDIKVFKRADRGILDLISAYKFYNIRSLSRVLAYIIRDDISYYCETEGIDLVTYVPVHKKVLKERGYNHLYLILREIFPERYVSEVIKKVRDTYFQAELTAVEREKNLIGAFKLENPSSVKGKKVLVFDDILTTGSTLKSVYAELKKGKPEEVYAYVIAR
ncbi:ComF family protein [Persephonella sp.]